ncbi:pyridoxamine 5'-phosphate oxidase-related FMN-binding [Desulfatibacillum aliphaticivorans]|uniref:Pyridoxamine 5'-phosphate oxidase-related FMN-binding n=1 Tax=Desulfatibacillum aliphaticivorans TaxID=218208 RepID=B8FFB4_DESAL|nr:pyridoxamine 5'-phosphate oxidase family protein [Desulfatibacillum aliphaticivorans]ACL04174.1 pyridoxamine 5'-phosphate oxidase-related FMN-binding [Desulfatibacillum aliphaticivorans]
MRRKDKEIVDIKDIESVIAKAQVCRLALSDQGQPYVIPMNFGYSSGVFYFHSAHQGRKIEILRKNPLACVELDIGVEPVPGDGPCEWGMRFQSVAAMGEAVFIEDLEEKKKALDLIMARYTESWPPFPEASLKNTTVFAVNTREMTGKQSGQPG